jgi:hypothetical protein
MKNTAKNRFPKQTAVAWVGSPSAAARLVTSRKPLPDLLHGHTHGLRKLLIFIVLQACTPAHVIAMSSVPLIYTLFST